MVLLGAHAAGMAAAGGKGATMAAATPYLAAASLAMSAGGQILQGRQANQQGKLQAEMYRRQAEREKQIGELNAKREARKNALVQGTQRALLAANGMDASTGSALLVQGDLAAEGKLNEELIKNNATAAVNEAQTQAVLARAIGKNTQTASYLRAGSTLLKGTAEAFG